MSRKQEIVMVAKRKKTAQAMKRQLGILLSHYIHFLSYSLEEWLKSEKKAKAVIVSTHTLAHQVAQKARKETKSIILRRSFGKDSWEKILTIPQGKRVLLVNDDRDLTLETMALLCELGA